MSNVLVQPLRRCSSRISLRYSLTRHFTSTPNRSSQARPQSTNNSGAGFGEGDAEDFRPPWVYTGSRLLSYIIIPSIGFYSVFFYDFGDRDHVFQPIRQWASGYKDSFFTLSATERNLMAQTQMRSNDDSQERDKKGAR